MTCRETVCKTTRVRPKARAFFAIFLRAKNIHLHFPLDRKTAKTKINRFLPKVASFSTLSQVCPNNAPNGG